MKIVLTLATSSSINGLLNRRKKRKCGLGQIKATQQAKETV
jgi:hypothetical protein